ncbi:xylulokinase [Daejeonella lutea]|uniref:Xylulokinase n=1 Tax=Daejeonella lutea TaxID=572036 RepID=A0A1T5D2V7_9SPHI|nr:FGGY family carbohydrate kinase [Daejeonella lutea]SKB65911.1 xylulokinase [Daejeonella lutea]
MLLLGIDLGTSSIKVSVTDSQTQKCIASAQYPETESEIIALKTGWAEQSPEIWWEHVQQAILICNSKKLYDPRDIKAVGIAYQMHGLVVVDKDQNVLRNSIIWCDSRAVEIGNNAFKAIGADKCLKELLNSPGNFTASKLAWVKANEPDIYHKIDKVMLPGDFIAMKLTGEITTSISALSEGVFWNFKEDQLSGEVKNYYGFDPHLIPDIQPVFSEHGKVKAEIATALGLSPNIAVTYKAGDQPNNALSLNVLKPGEVAANAGTSGVVYGVSDQLTYDNQSRINTFAHVNYTPQQKHLGVLLCINGTGILNRWVKNTFAPETTYDKMNAEAATVESGSNGIRIIPFGNGAERMLNNKTVGAHFHNLDLNVHKPADIFRAVQEGIAFSFRYGLDIMRENGMSPTVIRAGKTNMFSSKVFTESFVNACGVPVELYENDGSVGAAIGAGIGVGELTLENAFSNVKALKIVEPDATHDHEVFYQEWKELLTARLEMIHDA